MCNYFLLIYLLTYLSIIVGFLTLSHKYCKSQKRARALCHEAYKEVRENETNTRNKAALEQRVVHYILDILNVMCL